MNNNYSSLIYFLLIYFLLTPLSLQAQTTAPPMTQLQAIQVRSEKYPSANENYAANTATEVLRSNAALFETAQSVSVITQWQIEEKQAKTVAEALQDTAGVTAGAYGRRGWDDFIIRGQISSAQTYVDGLRAQTSTSVLRSEDMAGIESITVVKGPTSVGFGMALPGGLVNVTTKRPQAQTFYRANVSAGSYHLKEIRVDLNYAANNSANGAFRIFGRASDQDDPTDYVYFKNRYLAAAYNFDWNARNALSIIASYQKRNYIRNQGIPQNWYGYAPRSIFIGEPNRNFEVDVWRLGANYTHFFTHGWRFQQNLAITQGTSWSNSVFAGSNAKFPVVSRQISNQNKRDVNYALDSYVQRHFNYNVIDHELTVGLDMMRERSDHYLRNDAVNPLDSNDLHYGVTSIKPGTPRWNLSYNQYIGLYIRDRLKVNERWIVGLSARQDWAKVDIRNQVTGNRINNTDTARTGSASLMYRINDFLAPYISHSTSFMPVTALGAGGTLLSPETGTQTETGLKFQALEQRLQGYAAAYALKRQNVTENDAALGYAVQTGEQTTQGLEAELQAALTAQWNVSATYSHIPTAKTSKSLILADIGKRTNHVPKNATALSAHYHARADNTGWHANVAMRWQSARTAQRGANFVYLPAYALFDAGIGYNEKPWTLRVGVKNLFNKAYIQGTTPAAHLITFGSPRTFLLEATLEY